MYAIYVYNYATKEEGWIRNIKINKGKRSLYKYNGKHYVETILSSDISQCITWKTQNDAIDYADELKDKLETTLFLSHLNPTQRYKHQMDCLIRVMDIENNILVHEIERYVIYSHK